MSEKRTKESSSLSMNRRNMHQTGQFVTLKDKQVSLPKRREQIEQAKKKGLCPRCFHKTHSIKRVMGIITQRIPLTISGQVFEGKCLICDPGNAPHDLIHKGTSYRQTGLITKKTSKNKTDSSQSQQSLSTSGSASTAQQNTASATADSLPCSSDQKRRVNGRIPTTSTIIEEEISSSLTDKIRNIEENGRFTVEQMKDQRLVQKTNNTRSDDIDVGKTENSSGVAVQPGATNSKFNKKGSSSESSAVEQQCKDRRVARKMHGKEDTIEELGITPSQNKSAKNLDCTIDKIQNKRSLGESLAAENSIDQRVACKVYSNSANEEPLTISSQDQSGDSFGIMHKCGEHHEKDEAPKSTTDKIHNKDSHVTVIEQRVNQRVVRKVYNNEGNQMLSTEYFCGADIQPGRIVSKQVAKVQSSASNNSLSTSSSIGASVDNVSQGTVVRKVQNNQVALKKIADNSTYIGALSKSGNVVAVKKIPQSINESDADNNEISNKETSTAVASHRMAPSSDQRVIKKIAPATKEVQAFYVASGESSDISCKSSEYSTRMECLTNDRAENISQNEEPSCTTLPPDSNIVRNVRENGRLVNSSGSPVSLFGEARVDLLSDMQNYEDRQTDENHSLQQQSGTNTTSNDPPFTFSTTRSNNIIRDNGDIMAGIGDINQPIQAEIVAEPVTNIDVASVSVIAPPPFVPFGFGDNPQTIQTGAILSGSNSVAASVATDNSNSFTNKTQNMASAQSNVFNPPNPLSRQEQQHGDVATNGVSRPVSSFSHVQEQQQQFAQATTFSSALPTKKPAYFAPPMIPSLSSHRQDTGTAFIRHPQEFGVVQSSSTGVDSNANHHNIIPKTSKGALKMIKSASTKVPATVAIIKHFANDARVQGAGIFKLWEFCDGGRDVRFQICQAGGIKIIMDAMQAHPLNADIQTRGCGTLVSLSQDFGLDAAFRTGGGLDVIVTAMRLHPRKADVQSRGCSVLMNLASNPELVFQVGHEAKSIDVIIEAMRFHSKKESVLNKACGALQNLGTIHENRIKITVKGGVKVIVGAMKVFPKSESLQIHALGAICNLCLYQEATTYLRMENARSVVEKAQLKFPIQCAQYSRVILRHL